MAPSWLSDACPSHAAKSRDRQDRQQCRLTLAPVAELEGSAIGGVHALGAGCRQKVVTGIGFVSSLGFFVSFADFATAQAQQACSRQPLLHGR